MCGAVILIFYTTASGPGSIVWYSDWLRAGWSGDRILVGARFSAPVQTGPSVHLAYCTMGTGSFPGVKNGWGVILTTQPLLVPWSRKSTAIPLLPLRAVRPVQTLSACTVQLYLYSPYGPYSLYRASVPVQGCTLPYLTSTLQRVLQRVTYSFPQSQSNLGSNNM